MYKEHPVFEKPDDENIKVWRYLDFTKFVSLLDKQALFFTRVDRLGDPFEGSLSKVNIKFGPDVYKGIIKDKDIPNFRKKLQVTVKNLRECTFINCWHMNEYESAAMWKLYLKSDEGVAIQSTFRRLKESFNKYEKEIYIGKIKYIDYETDWVPEGNLFYPFLRKRKSFEYERELRVIVSDLGYLHRKKAKKNNSIEELGGIYVPVNVNTLIEKIFVSPTAPKWFKDLVKSTVKRYNLKKKVLQSGLAEGPIY